MYQHPFNHGKMSSQCASSVLLLLAYLPHAPQATLEPLLPFLLANKGRLHERADCVAADLLAPRGPAGEFADDDVPVPGDFAGEAGELRLRGGYFLLQVAGRADAGFLEAWEAEVEFAGEG